MFVDLTVICQSVCLEIWVENQNQRRQIRSGSGFLSSLCKSERLFPWGLGCLRGKPKRSELLFNSCQAGTFASPSWDFFLELYLQFYFFCASFCKKLNSENSQEYACLFKYSLIDKYWLIAVSSFWFIVRAQVRSAPRCAWSDRSAAFLLKPRGTSDADWYKLSLLPHFIITAQEAGYSFSFP